MTKWTRVLHPLLPLCAQWCWMNADVGISAVCSQLRANSRAENWPPMRGFLDSFHLSPLATVKRVEPILTVVLLLLLI